MQPPLVSVVMPAYNAERTIAEAVRSVLGQGMDRLELIVCDDCSRDGTRAVLAAFPDPRLRVLSNERNLGAGRSRDRAIAAATAPWVAVIDADDAWRPDRLERLLACAGAPGERVVFDDLMICHDVQGEMVAWRPLHGPAAFATQGRTARDIRPEDYVTSPRLLIKPMFPARFAREMGIRHGSRAFGEDAEFFIRLAGAGASFRYLPEPLYLYRVTQGSATALARDASLMRQCIEDCARACDWSPGMRAAFARKIAALQRNEALYRLVQLLREGRLAAAFAHLLQNPGMLAMLPARALKHLHYQLHRIRHGGARR